MNPTVEKIWNLLVSLADLGMTFVVIYLLVMVNRLTNRVADLEQTLNIRRKDRK